MNSLDIRQKFLDFFEKNGHKIVSSSSLIPAEDPTLLFTNAGMNQFKDLFLGKEKRSYTRASTVQKCVRAGGKHNDLDQVGFTARHLTFFEMMGNFSFGDYFKKEAINFAWDFLTKEMKLDKEKLYITIYKTDDQAHDIWHKTIGVPENKIIRLGEKDNFWQMGDTGPCGPCTEIHIDRGPNVGCKRPDCLPGCDCDRYLEIWNLVFMQYNRQADGKLIELEKPGVDTGMGLERLCVVMQNKDSVFQIDSFQTLIKKIEDLTDIKYDKSEKNIKAAFHVLCDHVRSSSLLIADGCTPSNEGRGYVLRKIIRRAALFAQKLSDNQKLFINLAKEFIDYMSIIYPELKTNKDLILNLLESEIEKFATNLIQGQNILTKYMDQNLKQKQNILSGQQVFKLYDTYGFPPELTGLIANESNFSIDMAGFEQEMKKQQDQSCKKTATTEIAPSIPENIFNNFVGYDQLETKNKIIFIEHCDDYAWLATETTPFYAESGGQVKDLGWITINEKPYNVLDILKVTNKTGKQIILCKVEDKDQKLKLNDVAHCVVDLYARVNTAKNHTAAHMLQAALIHVAGASIKQAGSFVDDKILRFDFTHHKALTDKEIESVEILINQKIESSLKVEMFETNLQAAKDQGVIAIFGEKYNPEKVRVVKISEFSAELCGGTHVANTGIIGCFKILSETSLSSGVRRITAVTGINALKTFQQSYNSIKVLSDKFKVKPEEIITAIEKQEENISKLITEIKTLKKDFLKTQIPSWQTSVQKIGQIPFLYLELDDFDASQLKHIGNQIESKAPGFYFIISQNSKNKDLVNYFGYVSKDFEKLLNLKDFSKFIQEELQLKGGGSSNLIQGGGPKFEKEKYIEVITQYLKKI